MAWKLFPLIFFTFSHQLQSNPLQYNTPVISQSFFYHWLKDKCVSFLGHNLRKRRYSRLKITKQKLRYILKSLNYILKIYLRWLEWKLIIFLKVLLSLAYLCWLQMILTRHVWTIKQEGQYRNSHKSTPHENCWLWKTIAQRILSSVSLLPLKFFIVTYNHTTVHAMLCTLYISVFLLSTCLSCSNLSRHVYQITLQHLTEKQTHSKCKWRSFESCYKA